MNHLNSAQVEQLKKIGAHLRQIRQNQSIPIEAVAAKTYIQLRLLKALEEGQSDQLPEPVFIQGFIRRYGDALGLDGIALAKTFPTSLLPVGSDNSSQVHKPRSRVMPLYALGILLVAGAASGLFYLLNRQRIAEPVAQKQNAAVAQPQKAVQRPKSPVAQPQKTVTRPVVSLPAKPKPSKPSLPIQVTVNLKEQSWLRVIVDGKTQFEGILTKGKRQTWTAKKQMSLRAGNAGAVLISLNRKTTKILGNLGQVKEVKFTPDQ